MSSAFASTMVFWLYKAQQYQSNTPLMEIAEHAQLHGFNDLPTEVLCPLGYEHIPAADLKRLSKLNFKVKNSSKLFSKIARRYPNLRARFTNHYFECFLRWILIKEHFGSKPVIAWDADIFYNDKLSVFHKALKGSTFTAYSSCFAAISDRLWLANYEEQLDIFENNIPRYVEMMRVYFLESSRTKPEEYAAYYLGRKIAAEARSPETWISFFDKNPEETFVNYLIQTNRLPTRIAKKLPYLFSPLLICLPEVSWAQPDNSVLPSHLKQLSDLSAADTLHKRKGRYYFGEHLLAFIHYQGALTRLCCAHLLGSQFYKAENLKLFDPFYSPEPFRKSISVPDFINQFPEFAKGKEEAVEALMRQFGNPFSERDVARQYLIEGDLTQAFTALHSLNPHAHNLLAAIR